MTGGPVMSNPKRTLGLLGVLALTISACSNGGSASSAPASGAPSAAAPSAAVSSAPSEAAAPATVDWWHITTGEPGKSDFQAIAEHTMTDAGVRSNPRPISGPADLVEILELAKG